MSIYVYIYMSLYIYIHIYTYQSSEIKWSIIAIISGWYGQLTQIIQQGMVTEHKQDATSSQQKNAKNRWNLDSVIRIYWSTLHIAVMYIHPCTSIESLCTLYITIYIMKNNAHTYHLSYPFRGIIIIPIRYQIPIVTLS